MKFDTIYLNHNFIEYIYSDGSSNTFEFFCNKCNIRVLYTNYHSGDYKSFSEVDYSCNEIIIKSLLE